MTVDGLFTDAPRALIREVIVEALKTRGTSVVHDLARRLLNRCTFFQLRT